MQNSKCRIRPKKYYPKNNPSSLNVFIANQPLVKSLKGKNTSVNCRQELLLYGRITPERHLVLHFVKADNYYSQWHSGSISYTFAKICLFLCVFIFLRCSARKEAISRQAGKHLQNSKILKFQNSKIHAPSCMMAVWLPSSNFASMSLSCFLNLIFLFFQTILNF